jgi:uncharacterized protein (DUF1810 family)
MILPRPPTDEEPPAWCRYEELAREENAARGAANADLAAGDADLTRFILAQEGVFERALDEIRQGRKQSHWMWFIFPQLRGLGRSEMAHRFGIASVEEAVRFLDHPLLGSRLRTAVNTLQDVAGESAEEVFGSIDAVKLRSCLTLFGEVDGFGEANGSELFTTALAKWFGGQKDAATLGLLAVDPTHASRAELSRRSP